jgi:hypothetical protein
MLTPASHDGVTLQGENRVVSPELVLVDPGLATWARDRLPAPSDTLARASPSRITEQLERPPERRRKRLMIGALVLAFAVTAFLADVPGQVRRFPAVADRSEPSGLPVETDSDRGQVEPRSDGTTGTRKQERAKSRSVTTTTAAPAQSAGLPANGRRFAWAPIAGASGYHIELFRGSALVFRADSAKPQIVIRRRWRLGGRQQQLKPGTYRWYVWPLVAGRRKAKATVQAKLVVPR